MYSCLQILKHHMNILNCFRERTENLSDCVSYQSKYNWGENGENFKFTYNINYKKLS